MAFKTWVCEKLSIEFDDTYFESLEGIPLRTQDHMPLPYEFRLIVRSNNIVSVFSTVQITAIVNRPMFTRIVIL